MMVFEGFWEYLQVGYFEPLPKRLLFAAVLGAFFFFVSKAHCVQTLTGKLFVKNKNTALFLILLLAFFIRIFYAIEAPTKFPTRYGQTDMPMAENSLIQIYAVDIAKGGLPYTHDGSLAHRRAMGYPYMLGAFYKLFGFHSELFKVIQVVLGVTLVWLAFMLAKVLFNSESIAFYVGFFMSFLPQNIIATPIILDEYPFFCFLFAALILIAYNLRSLEVKHTLSIGLLLGLAAFCRTHALLVPFVMGAAYLFCGLKWQGVLRQVAVCIVMIVLINTPWALQVKKHYNVFSFSPPYASIAFYGTLNDRAWWHNGYLPKSVEDGGKEEFLTEKNPYKQAKLARGYALEWIVNNPVRFVKLFFAHNLALLGFNLDDEMTNLNLLYSSSEDSLAVKYVHIIRKAKAWFYGLLIFYGLLGFILIFYKSLREKRLHYGAVLLLFLLLYWLAIHGALFGFRKYRWFIELIMIYPASYFLYVLSGAKKWIKSA